jgi:hypothetical protein
MAASAATRVHWLPACHTRADPSLLDDALDPWQQLPDLLLLDYLAAAGGGGSASSSNGGGSDMSAARSFVCCRMLHDALQHSRSAAGEELSAQQLTLLLVQHRKLQDSQLPLLGRCLKGRAVGVDSGVQRAAVCVSA